MMFFEYVEVQCQRGLPPVLCWPHGRTHWFWPRQASRAFERQLEGPGGSPWQRQACSSAADTQSLSRRHAKPRDGQKTNAARPDAVTSPE